MDFGPFLIKKKNPLKQVYQLIQHVLSLSYNESKGFFGLFLISIFALILLFLPKFISRHDPELRASDVRYLDSLSVVLSIKKAPKSMTLFDFDPNKIPMDSLVLLGLPKKTATTWVNYRAKGGRFYTKKDVQKIYGIQDEWFQKANPYILLPDSSTYKKNEKQKFNLNIADIEQIKTVPGVGAAYGTRIIKFRESLGGFVDADQLHEVYGLTDTSVKSLVGHSYIQKNFTPRKIHINHDEKEKLLSHPYISKKLAEDIIRFREINKTIESENVLADFKSVDKANFEKLILYLDFQ